MNAPDNVKTIGEYKQFLRDENKRKFGKWGSDTKRDKSINLSRYYLPIETKKDINHLRNAMATSNYPLSISDCEVVGINGNCGIYCPVFMDGDCETQLEMWRDH